MARGPGCYLHLAFLLHLLSFGSLLAGYCTPYWTVIKMSTGNVRALGLVVSCDIQGCDMLHVTQARVVFIVVFGMATGSVLFALFALQVYCLALCNGSCRQRNMGAGLSYFSMFIAFSVGGTLGLYQIDLQEEEKPDVVSTKIGWSRYAVIGSAGGFLLGAWLSVADFVRRHRLRRQEAQNKAEAKSRLITVSEQVRQQDHRTGDQRPLPPGQGRLTGPPSNVKGATAAVTTASDHRPARMASTVQSTMRAMAVERNARSDKQRRNSEQPTPGDRVNPHHIGGSRCITVDERAKVKDASSTNRGEREPRVTVKPRMNNVLSKDEAMAEAAKKYKLTKSSHVESIDDRKSTLTSVEEEKCTSGAGRRVTDLGNRKKSLNVSENLPTVSRTRQTNGGVNDIGESISVVTRPKIVKDLLDEQQRTVREEDEYDDDIKEQGDPRDELGLLKVTGTRNSDSRRASTVEEALMSVRSMLASIKDANTSTKAEPLPKGNLPTAVSLTSSVDSVTVMTPIKQRLPSIDEILSDRDKARQRKRLEKLKSESRSTSLDSKSVTEKDGKAMDKVGKVIAQRSADGNGEEKISGNTTFDKGNNSGEAMPVKTVDVNSDASKDEKRGENSKADEEKDRKQRSGQLVSNQCLSEEQIKRNQIVEALANARRDKKKRRITQ